MIEHYANDIRLKKPSKALKADYGNSRSEAIHLMCLCCSEGTAKSVRECTDQVCPLFQYRANNITKIALTAIPSRDVLEELKESKISDAKREQGRKLGQRKQNEL